MKPILLFSIFLIFSFFSFAQTYDGDYCPGPGVAGDEYAAAQSVTFTPPNNSTCNVFEIFALLDESTPGSERIVMGFEHGNGGQALFRFFFNTDCDATTGSTMEPLREGQPALAATGGAEYRVDISANAGAATVYTAGAINGDGTANWIVASNTGFNSVGGNVDTDGTCNGSANFIEVEVPVAPLFNTCDPNPCGAIELTTVLSNSGNAATSQDCQSDGINIVIDVNNPPVADFSEMISVNDQMVHFKPLP